VDEIHGMSFKSSCHGRNEALIEGGRIVQHGTVATIHHVLLILDERGGYVLLRMRLFKNYEVKHDRVFSSFTFQSLSSNNGQC
jgi:hypothetical protein